MSRAQKISLLIALYFAQGLPFGFFTIALPAMLQQSGQSLKTISLVSVLLTLPWLLKFLWAPFVDHRGTRRGWLLTLQLSALAAALRRQLRAAVRRRVYLQSDRGDAGHRDRWSRGANARCARARTRQRHPGRRISRRHDVRRRA